MFQFANASDLEIKKQIKLRMGTDEDLDADPFFDDVAKIGALLSDEQLCLAYSVRLNDALVAYAKRTGVFNTMTKWRLIGARNKLDTPSGRGTKRFDAKLDPGGASELTVTTERHKHHKVLSGYLSEIEAAARFNEGAYDFESKNKLGADVTLSAQAGKAVTLPGFVPATVFRQQLLAKARHFKDPSVGALHGEFTHRIQWALVCDHLQLTKCCEHSPADIFMACARPVFCGTKSTVWDLVFEGAFAQDFRKPEGLTEYFLRAAQPTHPKHAELWFLAGLIEGRYAKRQIEKASD